METLGFSKEDFGEGRFGDVHGMEARLQRFQKGAGGEEVKASCAMGLEAKKNRATYLKAGGKEPEEREWWAKAVGDSEPFLLHPFPILGFHKPSFKPLLPPTSEAETKRAYLHKLQQPTSFYCFCYPDIHHVQAKSQVMNIS